MNINRTARCAGALAVLLFISACQPDTRPETVLAAGGQARFHVVVSDNATEAVRAKAQTLATHLGLISDADFVVTNGTGEAGIAVGVVSDFPDLPRRLIRQFDLTDAFRKDEYLLRSHAKGLYLLGATELAVSHAVWDCLYRLGYRRYFPPKKWEIIPNRPTMALTLDAFVAPDFIGHDYSGIGWDTECTVPPFKEWKERNRMSSGFDMRSHHVYQAIIATFRNEFKDHPEYYGLENGERSSHKICISNTNVQHLAVSYATNYLARHPDAECVSMEPSDGARWCECEPCAALGSISDRALTLANVVARSLQQRNPGKYVGMLAYHLHAAPPTIPVEPNVLITIATQYATGGLTFDQIRQGWLDQGARLGVYDYLSLWQSHRNLPGNGKAANTELVASTIAGYHSDGFSFYNGESCDSWGPTGLGHYLGTRYLWDTGETEDAEALLIDFLTNCFGAAHVEMRMFYELIDGKNTPLLSDDLVGRMYRLLHAARRAASDPSVLARIDDLVLYTRYVELHRTYSSAPAKENRRQEAFETFVRHAYRIRSTGMVDAKAVYLYPGRTDRQVAIPSNCTWRVAEPDNPWKSSASFTANEIDTIIEEGIARNAVATYEAFENTAALVPADLPPAKRGTYGRRMGPHHFMLWAEDGALPDVTFSTGHSSTNRGGVRWELLSADETLLESGTVPPDCAKHTVSFRATMDGLHHLRFDDQGAGTSISWPPGSTAVGVADKHRYQYGIAMQGTYFYVPAGTTQIVAWVSSMSSALFADASGRSTRVRLDAWPGLVTVDVAPGQDGQPWSVAGNVNGQFILLNVPPYLALSPGELLLPKRRSRRSKK